MTTKKHVCYGVGTHVQRDAAIEVTVSMQTHCESGLSARRAQASTFQGSTAGKAASAGARRRRAKAGSRGPVRREQSASARKAWSSAVPVAGSSMRFLLSFCDSACSHSSSGAQVAGGALATCTRPRSHLTTRGQPSPRAAKPLARTRHLSKSDSGTVSAPRKALQNAIATPDVQPPACVKSGTGGSSTRIVAEMDRMRPASLLTLGCCVDG
mmetsp:Transcript_113328/g.331251  ORF Transcript_113328/g.331251 Transcript_113328/m.331251 type:complete len:212 (-) Transcript_113328:224-859(-)